MSKELNNIYRLETRLLKANKGIKYKEMQEYLKLSKSGFMHWINKYYDLSDSKLEEVAAMLQELNK